MTCQPRCRTRMTVWSWSPGQKILRERPQRQSPAERIRQTWDRQAPFLVNPASLLIVQRREALFLCSGFCVKTWACLRKYSRTKNSPHLPLYSPRPSAFLETEGLREFWRAKIKGSRKRGPGERRPQKERKKSSEEGQAGKERGGR